MPEPTHPPDTPESTPAGRTHPNAWAETLRRWWEAVAPAYPQADPLIFDKFIPQAAAYLVFGEQTLKLIQAIEEARQNDQDWREALQQGFDRIRETFFEPFQGGNETHPDLAAFWGLPLDTLQRIATSLSFSPTAILQALPGAGLTQTALPPGDGHEGQEQIQQGEALWLDYQKAHREYAALLRRAAMGAVDLLQDRLIHLAETGKTVESVREFYNLWVECSEAAYAETVHSEEYSRVNGHMINSLLRFKRHSQGMVDAHLSALDIPQRAELSMAQTRIQETRRRLSQVEEKVERIDHIEHLILGLHKEIKVLGDELDALKATLSAQSNSAFKTQGNKP